MSSLTRIQQTTRVTLTKYLRVDGQLTDATGDLTATLKRLDGTTVDTATATRDDLGTYTYTPPEQADVDYLTLDWTGTLAGAAVSIRDYVEIVGGFYFGLQDARDEYQDLRDVVKWPWAKLAAKRTEVEQECDTICGRAFVPRYARVALRGNGRRQLTVPHSDIRTLRALSVDGTAVDITTATLTASGILTRAAAWIWGASQSVIVEYEYGADFPPGEISTATMMRMRSKLGQPTSSIPERALSWTLGNGGVFRISTPGGWRTGIPDVDAVYERHSTLVAGFA